MLGTLGAMGPAKDHGNERALLGLGVLLRRVFELSLQLRDREAVVLRLKSSIEQARAVGVR